MRMDEDDRVWNEFVERFEASRITGEPSEEELQAEATVLYRAGNRLAIKAAADANRAGGSGTMGNPVHELARIYYMYSTDLPGQRVPSSMDESGLWRP